MRRLLAVCLVLTLIVAACGDDDGDGGGGDSGATESVPTPQSEPTSTQSEPQPANGCSTDYPRHVDAPPEFSGFAVLCDVEGGTQMSIRNIGAAVLIVSPNAQQWLASDATPAPEQTFAFQLVQTTIPAACGSESCSVPPGATLTISADVPVRAMLDVSAGETVAATLARSLGDLINGRLGTPGERFADQIVNCAQKAPQALQGDAWEEAFRNTLNATSSCLTVVEQLGGTDAAARERAAQRIIAQARRYTSGAWIDGLLIAAKAIH